MIRRTLRLLLRIALVVVLLGGIAFVALRLTNPRPQEEAGWEQLTALPKARGEVAAAVADGKLYVVGGLFGAGSTDDTLSIYDIEADTWSEGGRVAKLHHAAAASIDDAVYVSGGAKSATDWTPSADVWWVAFENATRIDPMPEGRQGHAMVALDRRLYVVGGVGETDDTLVYGKGRWERASPLPDGRDHLRAVAWRDRVWALGGRVGGDPVTRVDIYDPERDRWEPGPALPEPMSAMAVGVIDDALHVIGGEDPDPVRGGVLDDHFVLERGTERWKRSTEPPLAVHGAGYGVHGGKLFMVAGASRQGALSTISWTGVTQVFDPSER